MSFSYSDMGFHNHFKPTRSGSAARVPAPRYREAWVRKAPRGGAWFAVAADTPEVNRAVAEAATARRVFVNVVDVPEHATAYAGGVFQRGGVTIAVSTDGDAPALAGLLREGLEAVIPDEIATWVQEARVLRARQRALGVPMTDRRPQLLEALNRVYAGARTAALP